MYHIVALIYLIISLYLPEEKLYIHILVLIVPKINMFFAHSSPYFSYYPMHFAYMSPYFLPISWTFPVFSRFSHGPARWWTKWAMKSFNASGNTAEAVLFVFFSGCDPHLTYSNLPFFRKKRDDHHSSSSLGIPMKIQPTLLTLLLARQLPTQSSQAGGFFFTNEPTTNKQMCNTASQ